MRGEKTFDLGFTIPVSHGGEFVNASEVTVRAPNLNSFDVHCTMQGWVGKALMGFTSKAEVMQGLRNQASNDDDEPDDNEEKDVMAIMSMGLDQDDFAKFGAYVKRVLTNSKLASVGEGKLTDDAWIEIENAGGMEAAMRIMSEFTSFFFDALGSNEKTGKGKSRSSSSRSKAGSTKKTRDPIPG